MEAEGGLMCVSGDQWEVTEVTEDQGKGAGRRTTGAKHV